MKKKNRLGRTTSMSYDKRDRQVAVTDPLGNDTTTSYDANSNVTSVTDALGNVTKYSYDGNDRQTDITDALNETTTTTYDPEGNILSVTDPGGNTTSYAYDELYRLLTETDELGNVRSYAYDAVGNQIQTVDANNRVRQFVYDDLNRRTEEQWLDESSNPIRTITFDYDGASQLKEVSDEDSTYKYAYDDGGRLISLDNAGTPGVPNVVLEYSYDEINNLLSVAETIDGAASGIESFVYDELNRVVQTTQTGAGVTDKRVDFEYDSASRMTGVTRYSDLAGTVEVAASDYDYDIANRLTELTHRNGDDIIAEYDWSYDAVNRLTELESVDGSSSFSYDELDQLTDAEYSFIDGEDYSYDENGNRTNSGYETEADNRLSSDGTYSYKYDGEGNLIERTEIATGEVMELSWDYRNRLIGVEVKDSSGAVVESVEYVYDAFDRRLGKVVDGDGVAFVERFVYDGSHIALAFDEEGDLTNRYLHGPGVDQVLASEDASGEVLWGLTDNRGSVRDVVDGSGGVVNHIVYDGFGGVVSESDSTVEFRFGYTGREFDGETGLYFYRARYYDPQVGRFVSEDPIGFAGGDVNLYGYVGNNPTNFTDPTGLQMGAICNTGYDILPPDIDLNQLCQPQKPINLSPIHQQIIDAAGGTQVDTRTEEWNLGKAVQYGMGQIEINEFKNQWICGYREVIKTAARQFDIPPTLLAAIAHMEVGGDPHLLDDLAFWGRSSSLAPVLPYPFNVRPSETSFGNYSLQIPTAAEALGYNNPNQLSRQQMLQIIESLKNPRDNTFIAARHLSNLRDIYAPGQNADELTQRELMTIAGAYNAGAGWTFDELWEYGYAGGYGREAIQNRVSQHQLERILECGCDNTCSPSSHTQDSQETCGL